MVAAQVMRQGVEQGVAVLADHRLDGIQLRHPPGGRPGRPRQETLALAGNEVEKRVKSGKSYEITVRLEDGSNRVINEANAPSWRTGDRVRIVNGVIQSNA